MKPPAFQFYADDFAAGTCDLSAADVGAYIRLLCYQWSRGSIPINDPAKIARIAAVEPSADVLAKFPSGQNGRMEAERVKQAEYRQQQSDKGKASAQARFNRGSTVVQPEGQPKGNSPSPSPSPTPNKTVGRTAGAVPANDSEWLTNLAENDAYRHLNVRTEFAKMQAWCGANRKEPTRRRFVNWLNRAEKPISPRANYQAPPILLAPRNWQHALRGLYPDSRADITWGELPEKIRNEIESLSKNNENLTIR